MKLGNRVSLYAMSLHSGIKSVSNGSHLLLDMPLVRNSCELDNLNSFALMNWIRNALNKHFMINFSNETFIVLNSILFFSLSLSFVFSLFLVCSKIVNENKLKLLNVQLGTFKTLICLCKWVWYPFKYKLYNCKKVNREQPHQKS